MSIRVTIWNEYRHEQQDPAVRELYPQGMHATIADALVEGDEAVRARSATLDESEHGLSDAVLAETDVLMWWGHIAHEEVSDEVVDRVQRRVLEGMGLIVLHSGHHSKPFRRLMGTTCSLKYREAGERERVWCVNPGHPIAEGIGESFELERTEMYGEFFDVPAPEQLVFISWFEGGEVFRSGCTWTRGKGRIFYFRPGHETYPIYHEPDVQRVLINAVRWAAPGQGSPYTHEPVHARSPHHRIGGVGGQD